MKCPAFSKNNAESLSRSQFLVNAVTSHFSRMRSHPFRQNQEFKLYFQIYENKEILDSKI
ncbi:hypothetical protein OA90_17245 [Labrenzia sp. OB1]|nr:hypothetical protein OA90_17245 [Labrenzia sp. OB1]